MIAVTRTSGRVTAGCSTSLLSTGITWSGRNPRSWITEPTCAPRIRAAVSLIMTSSARDGLGRRPATRIARACGGVSIRAHVVTWPGRPAAGWPAGDASISMNAPRSL